MPNYPIWKDYPVTITDSYYYRVRGGVDPVTNTADFLNFYRGRVKALTGGGNATVYLNRICAPRMEKGVPSFTVQQNNQICRAQIFNWDTSSDGVSWSAQSPVTFENNWTYIGLGGPALQITPKFSPYIVLFANKLAASGYVVRKTYIGGVASTASVSVDGVYSQPLQVLSNNDKFTRVDFDGLTWDEVRPCAPGALYFRNMFGGWSSFLIDGSLKRSGSFDRHTRRIDVPNSTTPSPIARDEYDYVTERTARWELNTGAMTDAQALLFERHLLPSMDVWLHDFGDNTVYPVILETDAADVKTYKNGGRRVVTYTLTCRLAQNRIAQ